MRRRLRTPSMESNFIIIPRNSSKFRLWGHAVLGWAIFSFLMTPVQFGFGRGLSQDLQWMDFAASTVFIVDILLQFIVAFKEPKSDKWIVDPRSIAQRYALRGLSLHIMSCMPWELIFVLCTGLEDNGSGACAQMVFAPIDASVSDDIALIPSGCRVIPLDHGSRDQVNGGNSTRTLDLASTLEVSNASTTGGGQDGIGRLSACGVHANPNAIRSVLTLAFQFSYTEARMHESVACIAMQYVRNVVSSIQRLAVAFISAPPPRQLLSNSSLYLTPPSSPLYLQDNTSSTLLQEQLSLVRSICQSYKLHVGVDLVHVENESNEAYFNALSKLGDAVLCCSCKPVPIFTYANQAGLDMLEISVTSVMALQDVSLEKTFDEESNKGICTLLSQVMQQGYACLSEAGIRLSSMGRPARYERAIAWKVAEEEEEVKGVAFLYMNWSLV